MASRLAAVVSSSAEGQVKILRGVFDEGRGMWPGLNLLRMARGKARSLSTVVNAEGKCDIR
jgi:hypothetical protein